MFESLKTAVYLLLFVAVIYGIIRAKKLGYFDKKDHADAGVVPSKTNEGKYTGSLTPPLGLDGKTLTWGGSNDEHSPAYTAKVLAGRPDWSGLGYCQDGSFEFTVAFDGGITGAANVFGHIEGITGVHKLDANGSITVALPSHWIMLNFSNGQVTGKLWEGHDELKRSIVSGVRI